MVNEQEMISTKVNRWLKSLKKKSQKLGSSHSELDYGKANLKISKIEECP